MSGKRISPLKWVLQGLATDATPNRMALGIALGIGIGLIPKTNLIAVVWVALLFCLPANLTAGMLAMLIASYASLVGLPSIHRLGEFLLTEEALQPWIAAVVSTPLGAWTSLNNTLVAGGTVLGVCLFLPAYFLARLLIIRHARSVREGWLFRTAA